MPGNNRRNIVKVGGSLLTLPDLRQRLESFLDDLRSSIVLLVPGGGAAADFVRLLDRTHQLGEERSHWLALHATSFTAKFLHTLLARWPIVSSPSEGSGILDSYSFIEGDEGSRERLPHCWETTSDAIAARAAEVSQADELILLKSVALPERLSWKSAAQRGLVDRVFPAIVERAQLNVRWFNFRDAPSPNVPPSSSVE